MLKERLNLLFTGYDPAIQSVIAEILTWEQANISMKQPHFKEPIDQIISRIANRELDRLSRDSDESRGMFE